MYSKHLNAGRDIQQFGNINKVTCKMVAILDPNDPCN